MEADLKKIFNKINQTDQEALANDIWEEIKRRQKRSNNIRLFFTSFSGAISFGSLILVSKIMLEDLAQSGVYEYLSVVFSNNNTFFTYWQEFMLSIIESLPMMSIILVLFSLFVLFLSITFATKQIIKNQFSFI